MSVEPIIRGNHNCGNPIRYRYEWDQTSYKPFFFSSEGKTITHCELCSNKLYVVDCNNLTD